MEEAGGSRMRCHWCLMRHHDAQCGGAATLQVARSAEKIRRWIEGINAGMDGGLSGEKAKGYRADLKQSGFDRDGGVSDRRVLAL